VFLKSNKTSKTFKNVAIDESEIITKCYTCGIDVKDFTAKATAVEISLLTGASSNLF